MTDPNLNVNMLIDPRYNVFFHAFTCIVSNPSIGQYDISLYGNSFGINYLFQLNCQSAANRRLAFKQPYHRRHSHAQRGSPGAAVPAGFFQMLPFSDPGGIRYRFSVRIVDTSSMANLNVGMTYPIGTPSSTQSFGTYFNGYDLASTSIFNGNTRALSEFHIQTTFEHSGAGPESRCQYWPRQSGRRIGAWSAYTGTDFAWGYAAHCVWKVPPLQFLFAPFDLSDELELRSYGSLGTMATPRSAIGSGALSVWPNTLGNRNPLTANLSGGVNFNRGFYTAYSYSRALASLCRSGRHQWRPHRISDSIPPWATGQHHPPFPHLLMEWILPTNTYVWPSFPAPVAANPDISSLTPLSQQQCCRCYNHCRHQHRHGHGIVRAAAPTVSPRFGQSAAPNLGLLYSGG